MNFSLCDVSFLRRWLLALLLLCPLGMAQAADALVLGGDAQSYPVNLYLGVLEDPSGKLALRDVLPGPRAPAFAYPHKDSTNFGFTDSAFWARFELVNRAPSISDWLLEYQYPLLDRVDIAIVHPDGRIELASSGDTLPFASRAVKHRYPMFKINLPRDQRVTVYLRVHSEGAIQMPLILRSGADLLARDHEQQIVLGVYYGIVLAMLIYNAMLFLSVRERNYLYYSLYIGAWGLMQMCINGLAYEYLWPASPRWANMAMPFTLGVVMCTTAQFASSFLDLRRNAPRFAAILKVYLYLGGAVMLGALLLRYSTIIKIGQAGALTECIVTFAAGSLCLKRGGSQARYFMLAWSMLIIGSAMYVMQNSGWIPTVFLTEYGLQIGSAVEVLLFSFALAHRMKLLQEENIRIQREATDNLERRVQQRTLELSEAHQRLKDISRIDALTGIGNRAWFNEKAGIEWQRSMREKNAIGMLMIDIDHFKHVNDTYGHPGGDACLKEVARTLSATVHRITDDAFRFGGEEFIVMLPNTDLKGAMHMAEAMRAAIEALQIVLDGAAMSVTISVGVACIVPHPGATIEALVSSADQALYQAKRQGRNRVCGPAMLAAQAERA